jgi:hypothetical protein
MPAIPITNCVFPGGRAPITLAGAGAPAANYGAGIVRMGDIYVNTTNGALYRVTATNGTSTVTWTTP